MLQASPEAVCRECGKGFLRLRPLQAVCNYRCAKKAAQTARKQASKALRARKEALKTRKDWLKEVEKEANAYVRIRDRNLPCVSCGCVDAQHWNASHYRSVGSSPALRFDLANIHRACARCNLHEHGNLIPYRVELLKRIGEKEVQRLEGPQPVQKYTIEALKSLKAEFRAKSKALEAE